LSDAARQATLWVNHEVKTMSDLFDAERVYAAQSPAELAAEYDRVAESYDAVLVEQHDWRMPEIMAGIVAWLLPREARILDAACGTGLIGVHLKQYGFTHLEGLDISAGMLEVARRKDAYGSLVCAPLGEPLPYPDARFDAFTVAGAFTPGHAPAHSLDELVRITRPGGYGVFSLRDDVDQPDFHANLADHVAAGRLHLLKVGAPFQSLPRAEPHVRNRLYVYEKN
jgi:predicted TPR repeat methyltransferase